MLQKMSQLFGWALTLNLMLATMIYFVSGTALQVTIAGCDGGEKDEGSAVKNILNPNWTTGQGVYSFNHILLYAA